MPSRASLKTQVSRWENGHVVPHPPYPSLLAEIYSVDEDQLGLPEPNGAAPRLQSGLSLPSLAAGRVTPDFIACLSDMLNGYTRADNLIGPGHLLDVVGRHLDHLEHLLLDVPADVRSGLLQLCSRFAEFAGWLCQDAGDLPLARSWTDRALDFAEENGRPPDLALILMRKSNVETDAREFGRALSLAIAAKRNVAELPLRLQSLILRQQAIAHACAQEEVQSVRSAEQALDVAVQAAEEEPVPDQYRYCTPSYILMESGAAALQLSQPKRAARVLEQAIGTWPSGFERDRGLCLARLAVAELDAGEVERACAAGGDAISVVETVESARANAVLRRLNKRLASYHRVKVVSEIRGELNKLA